MRIAIGVFIAFGLCLATSSTVITQALPNPTVTVPRVINVSGAFTPADGQAPHAVEVVTLSIYAEPEGGLPLWQERQTVAVDQSGRFTLMAGATHPDGIPVAVFGAGQAQWMSLLFERAGEVEQPRVRITSVPYALKASDAETLGGLPASAYVRASKEGSGEASGDDAERVTAEAGTSDLVLAGTTNFLAKYVNSADVGNSAVYEAGGLVGLGTTTPADRLHIAFNDSIGFFTGLAVQNTAGTGSPFSGMLFYDHTGALGQFQGFNNLTHEYRINNIARVSPGGAFNGSINFMLGGFSRLKMDTTVGTTISGPVSVLPGGAGIGLAVNSSGSQGIGVENTNPAGTAVYARAASGYGVFGSTDDGSALAGFSLSSGDGVFGSTNTGSGVVGLASTSGEGVIGLTDNGIGILGSSQNVADGWAGFFNGDLGVTGTLFKGGGAFRIDHPLDPENKYLSHSFVESPDMKNIYDGIAVFDGAGEAIVILPDWFEALNRDFRYQLTPMGASFVPYIADEIAGNQFKIAGGISGRKVSWQVTGIRQDAFANANRIQVEEMKPDAAVGTYLYPDAFEQTPVEQGRSANTVSVGQRAKDRSDDVRARLRAITQKSAKR